MKPLHHLLVALLGSATLLLAGCGGGASIIDPVDNSSAVNGQAVQVAAESSGTFVNLVTTSVTICVPGTSNCQTIPNVHVDTGSTGLRLLASAVTLPLPALRNASSGNRFHTCAAFADGVTWGPVAQADVKLGGQTGSTISIQLIKNTSDGAPVPAACSGQGTVEDSTDLLGSNGVLGIGLFLQDCGATCVNSLVGMYYDCSSQGDCTDSRMALAQQVSNPVAALPAHNNGVVLQLPDIAATGARSVSGTLLMGIGTRSNNTLTGTRLAVPASGLRAGFLSASYNGRVLSNSFIDSGSSVYFVDDASLPLCPSNTSSGDLSSWYCPGSSAALSQLTFNLTLTGSDGQTATSTFAIANTQFLFGQSGAANLWAFNNLGAPSGGSFGASLDLGLPFFFGKSVFTAIETKTTPNGVGPYFAFQAYP